MNDLLSGFMIAVYLTIALFFLRFWTKTHDRLFALFSGAFALLSVQRLALAISQQPLEDQALLYLIRLCAFVVIIVAIVDKNRR